MACSPSLQLKKDKSLWAPMRADHFWLPLEPIQERALQFKVISAPFPQTSISQSRVFNQNALHGAFRFVIYSMFKR
ncbi:hypothetical protein VT47_09810 [Pseudomonas syringae pv. syringae]|nr:hypothetical protein VT47_09810 [Pseudomonas syringae pv. syringae]